MYHFARHLMSLRMRGGSLLHLFVEHQTIDQSAPACLLERPDLQTQSLTDFVKDLVRSTADDPTDARYEQTIEHRPQRKQRADDGNPDRNGYGSQLRP
jgi:hypothetical protein